VAIPKRTLFFGLAAILLGLMALVSFFTGSSSTPRGNGAYHSGYTAGHAIAPILGAVLLIGGARMLWRASHRR
jgi:hypothetical protein